MDVPQQILEAATRLMAERGFEGTSLSAIGEAVGIRKASLLYHFPSKEALRVAVLDRLLEHWNDALPRLLMAAVGTGHTRFEALLSELVDFFSADRDRARLLLREMLDRPAAMREYLQRVVHPWIGLIGESIRAGQGAGVVRPDVDPEAYVLNVVGLALVTLSAGDALGGLLATENGAGPTGSRFVNELVRIARAGLFDTQDKPRLDGAEEPDNGGDHPAPPKSLDREVI